MEHVNETQHQKLQMFLLMIACGLLALLGPCAEEAQAKVFLSRLEALKLAFPDCDVERQTHYLTDGQRQEAEELAGAELSSALAYSYRATCNGAFAGTAYFDSHLVRTLPETIMIVVDPAGKIVRIEIVEFSEPEDYIPMDRWYQQFEGLPLDHELRLKRAIRGVTGATLTARATTQSARRTLALHQVIDQTRQAAERDVNEPRESEAEETQEAEARPSP